MKVSAQTLAIPIFKVSQGTCPLARVNRASPGHLSANTLFIRAPEAPARKRPIYAGFRAYPFVHKASTECPKTP